MSTNRTHERTLRSKLADIPPVTGCNMAIALLALPLFALLEPAVIEVAQVGELVIQWGIVCTVTGVAIGSEGQSFANIGFRRPSWLDIVYAFVTVIAVLLVFVFADPIVARLGLPVAEAVGTMTTGVSIGVALAGAVTTGIVEEILFRGYPIERLLAYTDSSLLAGGLTWAIFTLAHAVVWPVGNLLQIAAVAAILTAVYIRRRTLVPVISAHVLVWVFAIMGQYFG